MERVTDDSKWEHYCTGYYQKPARYNDQSEAEQEAQLFNEMYQRMPLLTHPQVDMHTSGSDALSHVNGSVQYQFNKVLEYFVERLNSHENLIITEWYAPYIYFEVEDTTWQHYPCNYRALVSFDTSNDVDDQNRIASPLSKNQYQFARKGWISRIRELIGYEPTHYQDCGDKEKTSFIVSFYWNPGPCYTVRARLPIRGNTSIKVQP